MIVAGDPVVSVIVHLGPTWNDGGTLTIVFGDVEVPIAEANYLFQTSTNNAEAVRALDADGDLVAVATNFDFDDDGLAFNRVS